MFDNDNAMDDLQNAIKEPNKRFAEIIMTYFEREGFLSEDDIELLLSKEKCREQFFSDYAILKLVDINRDLRGQVIDRTNRNRYYLNPHKINGMYYVMTSQFYGLGEQLTHKDNRTPLWQWVIDKSSDSKPVKGEMSPRDQIENIKQYIMSKGFKYDGSLVENLYLSLKSKPFVILAGTSGTGKTRLVKLFAESIGADDKSKRYKMVPVRPDWSDSSDLFGHVDLNGKFVPGEILEFISRAQSDSDWPYILCLDEMNLARVEYYLSDFLSVIETREVKNGGIVSDPLIALEKYGTDTAAMNKYGEIRFPQNLYLVGTVNMDETTFPFSKKVLDRANTIEFDYVDLCSIQNTNGAKINSITAPNSFLETSYLFLKQCMDEDPDFVKDICAELQKINTVLLTANAHVGYRVRDEIVFYLMNNKKTGLLSKEEALDNEIMQKILPRIQGSSVSVKEMLCELFKILAGDYEGYQTKSNDVAAKMNAKLNKKDAKIDYPKSARKVAFMVRRFEEDGFTSYWL